MITETTAGVKKCVGFLEYLFETMPTEFCKPYDIVGMINEEIFQEARSET